MKPFNRIALALVTAGLAAATTVFAACSNSSTPDTVGVFDGAVSPDTGTQLTPDTGSQSQTDASTDAPVIQPDTGIIIDASLPDVGPCVSDAAVMYDAQICNSCFTSAQDPVNGCSQYAVNCVAFDNSVLPDGAP